jgi:hypothetical protein
VSGGSAATGSCDTAGTDEPEVGVFDVGVVVVVARRGQLATVFAAACV